MNNGLLDRQLKRYLRNNPPLPPEAEELFKAVSHAYDHYEEDRLMLERTLELNSIELTQANKKLMTLFKDLEEKNNDLLSSIRYAKMIQEAILPPDTAFQKLVPDHFIFFKPRDMVSGDFYWLEEHDGKALIAAVDCTGHGVPGAFMSIVGYNLLTTAVKQNQLTEPNLVLDQLNQGVNKTLRQNKEDMSIKDGMDIAFCSIDTKKMQLQYSGAYNPLYHFRDGHLMETKGDKFPIGISFKDNFNKFSNHTVDIQPGDMFYIFTDGFPDQFGGPKGKKFKYDQYKSMLKTMSSMPCSEQLPFIENTFNEWKGDLLQIDDVLVIGFKF